MKKIAVVGAGAFGCTVAYKLAKLGYHVDLFERNDDIFKEASGINQYRLHRGYHYPRSKETISSCSDSLEEFIKEYGESIVKDTENYYCIAKEKSLTSKEDFLRILKENNLKFSIESLDILNMENIDLCVKVEEQLFDPLILKQICFNRIKETDVNLLLNTAFTHEMENDYEKIIICTYANLNFLPSIDNRDYQYELCEKPVLKLPDSFKNKSVVIMDGPFMCIDPLGDTGCFVMGNVVYAIHDQTIGKKINVPVEFIEQLNNGIVSNPKITNIDKFVQSASVFFPEIDKAVHVGSMFTIRTVLPKVDKTDERPTLVESINDKYIKVFSGKIVSCVKAADDVCSLVSN